jgi:hypothetical protein
MRIPLSFKFFALGLTALIAISVISAYAAGISVPPSNLGSESVIVEAEDIKPAECSALYLTNIVSGSGIVTGTSGNDLIIGSSGADTIDGTGGDDCILGGGGDDTITGGEGNDVCLGGPGMDSFSECETEIQ